MENNNNEEINYEELNKEKDKIIEKLKKKIENMKNVFKNILNEKKFLDEDLKENKIIIQTLIKNNKNLNKLLDEYKKNIEFLNTQIEDLKEEKKYDRLFNLIIETPEIFEIVNYNNDNFEEENLNEYEYENNLNNYKYIQSNSNIKNNYHNINHKFDYDELLIDFIQFSIIEKKKNKYFSIIHNENLQFHPFKNEFDKEKKYLNKLNLYQQEQYNFDKKLAEKLQKEEDNKNSEKLINLINNNDIKYKNKKEENEKKMINEINDANNSLKNNKKPFIYELKKEEREYMNNNNLNFFMNIDEMNYEQLLNLEEKMGKVSLGVNQETIKKLGIKKYNDEEYKNCETCMICLDDFNIGEEIRQLDCLHIFHLKCIDHWLKDNKKCPVDFHEINFNFNYK